jgi:DNA polymerase-3 subunit alpha
MMATIPDAVSAGKQLAKDRAAGQSILFGGDMGMDDAGEDLVVLKSVPPWDGMTTLSNEKDALGFHVSGHPLDEHSAILAEFCSATASGLSGMQQGSAAVVAGMITRVRPLTTKRGDRMAMLTIEDKTGSVDAVVFPDAFGEYGSMIEKDKTLLFSGAVDQSRAQPSLQVQSAYPITNAPAHLATRVEVLLENLSDETPQACTERMRSLADALRDATKRASPTLGRSVETVIMLDVDGSRVTLRAQQYRMVPTREVLDSVAAVVGGHCIRVVGGHVPSIKERRNRKYARNN